jgi:NitT/TauT family transport system substrate-binding protein
MRWLAVLAALALATGVEAQQVEKRDVHIAVGGKSALYYLPLVITERLNYFKDEGLSVRISDFAGGTRSLEAVVGGSADVCPAPTNTINMRSRKRNFQAFVLWARRRRSASPFRSWPKYKSPGPQGAEGRRERAGLEHLW